MAIKAADQLTIVDITDAYSVSLTADSFTLAGSTSGTAASATTLTTVVQVYKGDVALTSSDVTIGTMTGITGATPTASGLTISIDVTTSCEGGLIEIPVTIGSGTDAIQFTKHVSISIATKGATGAGAYTYLITASPDSVVKSAGGTLTPSSVTFTSTRAQGTGNPAAYSGRFKIEYSSDGSTWSTGYTSSSNESSKAYSIPAGAILVRCSLYLAGGTTMLLGIKTVPVISDGAGGSAGKGVSSITSHYLATSASSGVTTSTSGWTTSIQSMTATNKYLWYYETINYVNPTSSSDTTPVIIGHFGKDGVDGDDAITVTITSNNGTIFKNTSGSTTLTANVFVGGNAATVASNGSVTYGGSALGSIYWYKDGTKVTTASKELLVQASAVSSKMVVTCNLEV